MTVNKKLFRPPINLTLLRKLIIVFAFLFICFLTFFVYQDLFIRKNCVGPWGSQACRGFEANNICFGYRYPVCGSPNLPYLLTQEKSIVPLYIGETEKGCREFFEANCPIHLGCQMMCTDSYPSHCSCGGRFFNTINLIPAEKCILETYETENIPNIAKNEMKYGIYLHEAFLPTENISEAASCLERYPNKEFYAYLQLTEAPTEDIEKLFDEHGMFLHFAARNLLYTIKFPAETKLSKEIKDHIRWIGVLDVKHKVSEDLWYGTVDESALTENGDVKLIVSFWAEEKEDGARKILDKYNASVESFSVREIKQGIRYISTQITMNPINLRGLASENTVIGISTVSPPPEISN